MNWPIQDASAGGAFHVDISDQPAPFISGEKYPKRCDNTLITAISLMQGLDRTATKSWSGAILRMRQIGKLHISAAPQQAESLAPHFEAPSTLKIKI